jgi:excisionase family DNA binding protein
VERDRIQAIRLTEKTASTLSMTETRQTEWMPSEPLLLSIEQTSALLNLSVRTVKRLLDRRELVRRKIGSSVRIPRSSIEAFLRKDHDTQDK